jgi:hypothetical protein
MLQTANSVLSPQNQYPPGFNSLSINALYLELFFSADASKPLAHGTAFLIDASQRGQNGSGRPILKFVTAAHCLTGRSFFPPRKHLSSNLGIPKMARIWLPRLVSCAWKSFDITLTDENGNPTFNIVSHQGKDCDIATFELECDQDFDSNYFLPLPDQLCFHQNYLEHSEDWQRDSVGAQLLISGFPLKRYSQKLALTIPAIVASEPRFPFELDGGSGVCIKYPFFLVSARTWTGQSGSPVFRSTSSGYTPQGEGWTNAAGATNHIVGIYTSRLFPDGADDKSKQLSDLGIVWPLTLLRDERYQPFATTNVGLG